ncbi:MAG: hypothetical protein WBW33_00440 [Bryobacteraceae bacterium]
MKRTPYYPFFMRIVLRAGNTLAVFLLLATAAFANTIACPSIGSGIPVATIPPGTGCAEIDKSFSGFIDTVLVGSLGGGAAFGFSASGMAPLGDTMFPVTTQLSVLGTQALTPSYQEAVNYNVVSNTGGSYTGGSYPTPATPGATWAISGVTFIPDISVNGNGQSANAFEEFCLNAATAAGCPLAEDGEIEVQFFHGGSSITSCFGIYCASANGNVLNFPTPVTQIAVGFDVVVGGATTTGVTLNNFETDFSGVAVSASAPEVPEPSTFLTVVVGLGCLVWCVRRAG